MTLDELLENIDNRNRILKENRDICEIGSEGWHECNNKREELVTTLNTIRSIIEAPDY